MPVTQKRSMTAEKSSYFLAQPDAAREQRVVDARVEVEQEALEAADPRRIERDHLGLVILVSFAAEDTSADTFSSICLARPLRVGRAPESVMGGLYTRLPLHNQQRS
jgi:hypothetical protein